MSNIRFRIDEFFRYTIPNAYDKVKEYAKEHPVNVITIVVITIILVLGVYQGVMTYRYNELREQTNKQIKHHQEDPYDIVANGSLKYLEEQLDVKDEKSLVKLFDSSEKYQGQLEEVIKKGDTSKNASQMQDTLNPVIDEIKNGPVISQQSTGLNFSDKPVNLEDNDAIQGVVLIMIDSKNSDEVQKVKAIMHKKHAYKIVVFDEQSPNGKANFNATRLNYLFGMDNERKGYNADNDWGGKMYAFNDDLFVWRSKDLTTKLPDKLPEKGLQGEKDISDT